MHLFAVYSRTVKRFDDVEGWTFEDLLKSVKEAFNIESKFALYMGDNELGIDSASMVSSSDVVSGDRLVVKLKNVMENKPEEAMSSNIKGPSAIKIAQGNESSSLIVNPVPSLLNKTVKEVVVNVMGQMDYTVCSDRGSIIQFKHENTANLTEIGLLEYDDEQFSIQINVIQPPSRRVPIMSKFFTKCDPTDLKMRALEQINFFVFGRFPLLADNLLVRLLLFEELSKRIFMLLPSTSVLQLESISKDALRICNEDRMERVWMLLIRRDFGDVKPKPVETYRECYKRIYVEMKCSNHNIESFRDLKREASTSHADFDRFVRGNPLMLPRTQAPWDPAVPDPDMPCGPFAPSDVPFGGFGPRFPSPDLRPGFLGNGEIMPSRPPRRQGQPYWLR
uniref:F-box domain-containing protein n=1 Tax=Syphacia muris TaxID=451379 RepID=A0A0N5AXN7_9BILA